ncbi:hypothetical protein AGMMS50289_13890 [Betaproteobacteria bacterium]|nr:hypothetical protein AGMMS50289_13890 [Betaproteobacteria bacterium]
MATSGHWAAHTNRFPSAFDNDSLLLISCKLCKFAHFFTQPQWEFTMKHHLKKTLRLTRDLPFIAMIGSAMLFEHARCSLRKR